MPSFGVTPQKQEELEARMRSCGLLERDIEERFITAGGPGGQKVNRSATCVYIKHRPSGLEVKMRKARSQGLNRFYARRRLCELLEANQEGRGCPDEQRRDKIRKQKKRRQRRQTDRSTDPN